MAAAYTMHFALPVGDKAMERSDAKYNGTANRLLHCGNTLHLPESALQLVYLEELAELSQWIDQEPRQVEGLRAGY